MKIQGGLAVLLLALTACGSDMPTKEQVAEVTKAIQKRFPNKFKEASADYREIFATDMDQIEAILSEEQKKTFEKIRSCGNWTSCGNYVMPIASPSQCNFGC